MFGMRAQELLIVFAILLLLFGTTKLPKLGASLGASIRNFKKGFSGESSDEKDDKKLAGDSSESVTSADKAATKQS